VSRPDPAKLAELLDKRAELRADWLREKYDATMRRMYGAAWDAALGVEPEPAADVPGPDPFADEPLPPLPPEPADDEPEGARTIAELVDRGLLAYGRSWAAENGREPYQRPAS
jgi:hypothetical protein